MLTVLKHTLSRSKGAILGWGITLALLGMMFVPFYDSIAADLETWEQLMQAYPPEILAFFGEASFTTPEGYLSLEYFSYMPLVVGVFAVLAGSGMLVADEERGVLDLIAALPLSRTGLFWGRFLSLVFTLLFIVGLGYVGIMISTTYSVIELDPVELITPFASMFAVLFFFAGFSLLLSFVLPSRKSAAMAAGIVLVGGFFVNGLANLNEGLADINRYLPLSYYQSSNWTDGLEVGWFLGLLGFGLLFTVIGWLAFLRRDIRVAGEGGWKFPKLSRILRRKIEASA